MRASCRLAILMTACAFGLNATAAAEPVTVRDAFGRAVTLPAPRSASLRYSPPGWPLAARGQQPVMPVIGFLDSTYAAIFFRGAGRCSIDRMIGKEF
jgi:ABC-type Fe3+-hydroxamate transport system substrate-binding protein